MSVSIIVGAQCGDEGKGKIVDFISQQNDLIIRYQGGDNAGHTVVNEYGTFKLHLIPCGIFNPHATSLIGTGLVVNPDVLKNEIDQVKSAGVDTSRLFISDRAHVLMPYHIDMDVAKESASSDKIGTTKRGIGPAYSGKANRINIRFGDLGNSEYLREHFTSILPEINEFLSYYSKKTYTVDELCELCCQWYQLYKDKIVDALYLVHKFLNEGKSILFEGQLGVMKDIDLGTYPFVTSSNPLASYAPVSAGIPIKKVNKIIGVAKAFSSQVGAGPFPTETYDSTFDVLRGSGKNIDDEFGARTGRARRLGWLDIPVIRFANMINGFDELAICKLDKLDSLDEIKICTDYKYKDTVIDVFTSTNVLNDVKPIYATLPGWNSSTAGITKYEELPVNARKYIEFIEQLTGVAVKYIGTGPSRNDLICR